MVLDKISQLVSDKEPNPNKFTIAVGELIKKAREEKSSSQEELAQKIYRRRATVSDIENGKVEVSSVTLALFAAALDKPITYFYPHFVYIKLKPEEFSPLEEETINIFRKISDEQLQKAAINQIKVLSEIQHEMSLKE